MKNLSLGFLLLFILVLPGCPEVADRNGTTIHYYIENALAYEISYQLINPYESTTTAEGTIAAGETSKVGYVYGHEVAGHPFEGVEIYNTEEPAEQLYSSQNLGDTPFSNWEGEEVSADPPVYNSTLVVDEDLIVAP